MIPFLLFIFFSTTLCSQQLYYPDKGAKWEQRDPKELGLKPEALQAAVQFAQDNEYSGPRDLRRAILTGFKREPYHEILGPVKKRGGPAGMVLKNGYLISSWGDINRVDMSFSVTKSYLSTIAGLALDAGLLGNVDEKVKDYVWDNTFQGDHNSNITWRHLLNQSSDWSGTLWGGHDWADRPPQVGGIDDWKHRELRTPGTTFEYNDVRVNVLAYSLLQVWRRPLPMVLKEKIMDPIGASTTWRWYGYENSWTNIDGVKMQSVSGGGHSGGGVFMSTLDHARFGLLFLRNGKWEDKQFISKNWIDQLRQPSSANQSYGFMWWLNKGDRSWEGVPDHIFYAAGFGGNYIVVDQKNDLVLVTRWLEPSKLGEMMQLLMKAL